MFPSLFTRPRLGKLGTTLGAPIVTGVVVSGGVLAIQLYFDAEAKSRDERRSLQVELGRDADLVGADLAGRDLTEFFLQGKRLTSANLVGATLTRANLRGASLVGTDLSDADLRDADLTSAKLRYARLEDADLTGATLELARLPQVRALNAKFIRANLVLAWMPADLRHADFTGAKLVNADLGRANLERSHFFGADLDGASFRGARLAGADFRGAKNLRFADFSGATYDRTTLPLAAFERCPKGTCAVAATAAHSFRDISPFLRATRRRLVRAWLPDGWESRDDRAGFTFSAPLGAAEITGENHAGIGRTETVAAFADSLRPQGLKGLQDEWTAPVRVRGRLAGCLHGFTWEAAGRVRRTALELYFLDGAYGFLFSAKADAASFHLYDRQFARFFDVLQVEPNPLEQARKPPRSCRA